MDPYDAYHEEVLGALRAAGNPRYGEHVARERGSALEYAGLTYPARRKIVARGFTFTSLPEEQVLAAWDALWRRTPNGDVLFAALDYYRPVVRKRVSPALWPVVRGWIERIDNWAHADELAGLYSRTLEAYPDAVYPQLRKWNAAEGEWQRRISIVSLIHYSGKNAVFLPPERVLPLVSKCLEDDRYYVQQAVGWVLRELGNVYEEEVTRYLEANAPRMSTRAFSRAIERREPQERARLRSLRRAASR